MFRRTAPLVAIATFALLLSACSTEPKTQDSRDALHSSVQQTLKRLYVQDPGLETFLNNAYAYAVFPTVGKGGAIVGGAYGHGEVYEQGQFVGYTDLSQATIGAQLGGQTFAEVLAFQDKSSLDDFKGGKFAFAASASAVAMKSGAAASAKYDHGVAVFVESQGGLMLEAAIGGQSFTYQPK
jgi:lipid-binding SYLF domain-containing protein